MSPNKRIVDENEGFRKLNAILVRGQPKCISRENHPQPYPRTRELPVPDLGDNAPRPIDTPDYSRINRKWLVTGARSVVPFSQQNIARPNRVLAWVGEIDRATASWRSGNTQTPRLVIRIVLVIVPFKSLQPQLKFMDTLFKFKVFASNGIKSFCNLLELRM